MLGFHGNGIAVREKQGPDPGSVNPAGLQKIFFDLLQFPDSEAGSALVDHTEGASVMRASDGCLYEQRIRLARWTIYGAFVSHRDNICYMRLQF